MKWERVSSGVYKYIYHVSEALEDCDVDYIDTDNSLRLFNKLHLRLDIPSREKKHDF